MRSAFANEQQVKIAELEKQLAAAQKETDARRSTTEPPIGHPKHEHRIERNYLAYRQRDGNNVVIGAVGYNSAS
jgi:IS5 family transposase